MTLGGVDCWSLWLFPRRLALGAPGVPGQDLEVRQVVNAPRSFRQVVNAPRSFKCLTLNSNGLPTRFPKKVTQAATMYIYSENIEIIGLQELHLRTNDGRQL